MTVLIALPSLAKSSMFTLRASSDLRRAFSGLVQRNRVLLPSHLRLLKLGPYL
jgi:hypothetical protein